MKILEHPDEYKTGYRVLLLRSRPKDGATSNKTITRISDGPERFNRYMDELVKLADPGCRIYATAGERDIAKAIRLFRQRQLDSEYDADPEKFYHNLNSRWASCMMAPGAQKQKKWLFDCDSEEDEDIVAAELYNIHSKIYAYKSKSGTHFIIDPFNKSLLTAKALPLLHDNAIMLWAF